MLKENMGYFNPALGTICYTKMATLAGEHIIGLMELEGGEINNFTNIKLSSTKKILLTLTM
jgi:hypothetical protein